eukprot:COSAG02_NODE_2425_length_8891_cov_48.519791_4_plen_163_part_00
MSIEGDPKGDKEDRDLKNAKWEMKKAKRRGLKKTTQSQKSKIAGSSSDTDQVVTEKANRLAQQLSTQTKIMALSSPKQCKGWTVFKNWKGFGVCKGTVMTTIDVLSRDFTLKELQEMGIYRSVGRGARSVYVDHYSGLHNKAPAPVRKCTSLGYYAPRIVGR